MPNTLHLPSFQRIGNYLPAVGEAVAESAARGAQSLQLPVSFSTADGAVLFTVPQGIRLRVGRCFLEVTTPWTGGAASAIGASSSNAGYNVKGDLLGGAAGDLAAGLANGFRGTVGAKLANDGLVVLVGGDTIRFDRIVSAFTAGAGRIHVPVLLLPAS